MVEGLLMHKPSSNRNMPIEEILAEEDQPMQLAQIPELDPEVPASDEDQLAERASMSVSAMVNKLHVNTGHSSKEQMMRLAVRCNASAAIKKCIASFKCGVCEELKPPVINRKTTMLHNAKQRGRNRLCPD